jgi:hypothetical protein
MGNPTASVVAKGVQFLLLTIIIFFERISRENCFVGNVAFHY